MIAHCFGGVYCNALFYLEWLIIRLVNHKRHYIVAMERKCLISEMIEYEDI